MYGSGRKLNRYFRLFLEQSVVCENKSLELQCHQNKTININYVKFHLWNSKCSSVREGNCHAGRDLINEQCNTKKNCTLNKEDFNTCSRQPRLVDVTVYCTWTGWWYYEVWYRNRIKVCGSLANISCRDQYKISGIGSLTYEYAGTCEVERDFKSCIEETLKSCIGKQICGNVNVNKKACFHLPRQANITYSCNTEGTNFSTATDKNIGNGIISTPDVPQRTIIVDITKPPKSDEIEWILDLDIDSRLLFIYKKRNVTCSLCAHNWTNEQANVVCRYLKRSKNGIAGDIPRNTNLSRIAYGLDCPVNFTNLFECKPDITNAAREVCKLTGDASVRCYNDTYSHFTDNTDWCINIIVVGSLSFATILISLLIIIYIQRRKLIKASYASLTVRRDQNHYNEIHHQMSDHIAEHNYEVSALSVIPTSEGQVATHQKIQHVDTSGYLILSGITETGGDHYQSIAN